MTPLRTASDLVDWRRRVGAMYAAVRAAAPGDAGAALARFRAERDALFAGHPSSPLDDAARSTFAGLDYYPRDAALDVEAALEPVANGDVREVHLGDDGVLRYRPVAQAVFALAGRQCRLCVYALEGYGGGIWLPFRDATCGRGSYGGGRYLYDTIKGADLGMLGARMRLDFNYAYNPSCCYCPRWVCPLAEPENALDVAVSVGERDFRKR